MPTSAQASENTSVPTYWTTSETAAYIRLAPGTLENWRCAGTGPRFAKSPSGRVRYRADDVVEWIESGSAAA